MMKYVIAIVVSLLMCINVLYAKNLAAPAYTQVSGSQKNVTPAKALMKLKVGNQRFLKNKTRDRQLLKIAYYTGKHGQHPFAFVLNCMDSRSVPEIVFDQGFGDIFSAGVAGNVIDNNILASMEYAVHVGVKVIVIMGHTHCGAITAACSGQVFGHIKQLIAEIKPAVTEVEKQTHNKNCSDPALINAIAQQNVKNMIAAVMAQSPYLRKRINDDQVMIIGAMHDIKTGKVRFFN